MNILALDLGTKTGWAVSRAGLITSGTESFQTGRYEGGGMRYLRFQLWLDSMRDLMIGQIDLITFEEVRRHAGTSAAHVYGGMLATLTAWCEHYKIPYRGVPVATIKKHATSKGNAGKDAMIDAMKAIGHAPGDDNEADALALLHFEIEKNGA